MPGIFKSTCFKRKILWTIHLLCWLQNLNMRMEEQRFESMYLLLRMVICQLVKQTLRKNHPESLTDSDRWVVLPFDIKICLFFIQTQKNFQSNVYIYIYLHTVHHICIREYICVYIYILYIKSTSNPHLPKHPLTTLRWLFFGDRAPFCGTFTPFASKSRQIWVTCARKPGWGGVVENLHGWYIFCWLYIDIENDSEMVCLVVCIDIHLDIYIYIYI